MLIYFLQYLQWGIKNDTAGGKNSEDNPVAKLNYEIWGYCGVRKAAPRINTVISLS